MRALIAAVTLMIVTAGPALAQTGSKGPSSTDEAAANAKAADGQSKGFSAPSPAGASLLVGASVQSENCAVPISAGIGTLGYGATVVWEKSTEGCEHRRTAWEMAAFGDTAAGKEELCELADARAAYARAGHPCQ